MNNSIVTSSYIIILQQMELIITTKDDRCNIHCILAELRERIWDTYYAWENCKLSMQCHVGMGKDHMQFRKEYPGPKLVLHLKKSNVVHNHLLLTGVIGLLILILCNCTMEPLRRVLQAIKDLLVQYIYKPKLKWKMEGKPVYNYTLFMHVNHPLYYDHNTWEH